MKDTLKTIKLTLLALGMAAFAATARAAYTDDCITFSSAEAFTLMANKGKTWDGTLWTSTDKTNWTEWDGKEVSAAQTGETYNLYVRGNEDNTVIMGYRYGESRSWILTGSNIACTGNIETLRGATGNASSPTKMESSCYYDMFKGCTSLTEAPALPATNLAQSCYSGMFSGCTALTNAPELPAMTLALGCYGSMFEGCTSLTSAPALPATTLADSCYSEMFRGCTSLESAPTELPATTLAEYCCYRMFYGCTALTVAPEFPAATLAGQCCCHQMFEGCTALKAAPTLPATTLAFACYGRMFIGCTALTSAPALPATTLALECYYQMFEGCTSLKTVPALPATTLAEQCYSRMFYGCTALEVNATAPGKEWKIPATSTTASYWGSGMFTDTKGTLQGQPALNTTYYIASAPVPPEPTDDCITFFSAKAFTLKTYDSSKTWDGTLWTSTDKTNWTEWDGKEVSAAQTGGTYNLHVYGNTNNTVITSSSGTYRWVLTGSNIACTGNIETLRGATGKDPSPTEMASGCYDFMFYDCTALMKAPALPATTLAEGCYYSMFSGCTSLKEAPALPATKLAQGCYFSMFWGCTALKVAPATLPATTLAEQCYAHMFHGCKALMAAPDLPATKLAQDCYDGMFNGCTALTKAPELPATTLAQSCYAAMFSDCTALTVAPTLPATKMTDNCYNSMFKRCKSLTSAPALPATTLAYYCCYRMFDGCTSLTNAPALSATTLAEDCYSSMFSGCTSLTDAPALPATELADGCYYGMFRDCTSLEINTEGPGKEWKIPVTSTTAKDWGTDMFSGTAGTLQGQPALNTTYYIKSAPMPPGSKGNPWKIGAGTGDTVEAWTNGTTLVVQGAGKMMDFDAEDSLVPWPVEQIAAVEIAGSVTSIGQNAWLGLADSVSYNNLSATAAKTMSNGFGGTTQYARTAFREFLVNGASINATVALETAKSLTNEWVEVELTDEDVHVENGRIVIQHESAPQSQGFYLLQPTE